MEQTHRLIKSKTKNALGGYADVEINKGKSETKTMNYMTLTQQINGMLDPMLGVGTAHDGVETNLPPEERDYSDIDLKGMAVNKYKPSKLDTMNIGEIANDFIRDSITEHERNIGERGNNSEQNNENT